MKVWKIRWMETDAGNCVAWRATRPEADAVVEEMKPLEGVDPDSFEISRRTIPTHNRDALCRWLSINYNRDNG